MKLVRMGKGLLSYPTLALSTHYHSKISEIGGYQWFVWGKMES